ncbi:MAG: rRNA (guanine966-N2)-methyltransferase [Desulfovibrionales bacterium]|jgi:16S rRNA (guanine966-N2)-methyltransferase|nr:rRNA (guanine966-N2)-methyltransferase [Desulfovibrionales bacterium]
MRITSGKFKGRRLKTVEGPGMRPATDKVREAVFSMLAARGLDLQEARVLDLFAGSGAMALEALSRGAGFALCVEMSRKVAACLRDNFRSMDLALKAWKVVQADALSFASRPAQTPFDVIFVDPPYGYGLAAKTLPLLASNGYLSPQGWAVAEIESSTPAPDAPSGWTRELDRTYGQTRIAAWTLVRQESPFTPERSTP